MEECFSVQIIWQILLKINKNPGELEFTDLPHGILLCQERTGLWGEGGLTLDAFPTPISPLQSVHPAKPIFLKDAK